MNMAIEKIAIIDDDQKVVDQLAAYLAQMYESQNIAFPFKVVTFTSVEAFQKALVTNSFDLLVADIYLNNGVDGLDLAQQLLEINSDADVIIISGYLEFLSDHWDDIVIDFISKPVTYENFSEAILHWQRKIRQRYQTFKLCEGGQEIILKLADILYIFSRENVLCIITRDKKQYQFHGRLEQIIENLKCCNFIRCHRSYVINLQHLVNIVKKKGRNGDAILRFKDKSTVSVPISIRKLETVAAAFNYYLNDA